MKLFRRIKVHGFTLVEVTVTIAVLAITASIAVPMISGSITGGYTAIAQQQQAAIQSALDNWISKQSSGTSSISATRTAFNAASTNLAKLALISGYLDTARYADFTTNTTDSSKIQSSAMAKVGKYATFSTWDATNPPKVNLLP